VTKARIHIFWKIILESYFCFDKDFKDALSRSCQGSPIQRGIPDREDTTRSTSEAELKLKYSGRTSLKTHSALVLTSNMQHSQI
jgi:hypothetical protein